jgi:hypothetical protein
MLSEMVVGDPIGAEEAGMREDFFQEGLFAEHRPESEGIAGRVLEFAIGEKEPSPAGESLGVVIHKRDEKAQGGFFRPRVRVEDESVFPLSESESLIVGRAVADIVGIGEETHLGESGLNNFSGGVLRGVVYHNDFHVGRVQRGVGGRKKERLQASFNDLSAVVRHDNDGEFRHKALVSFFREEFLIKGIALAQEFFYSEFSQGFFAVPLSHLFSQRCIVNQPCKRGAEFLFSVYFNQKSIFTVLKDIGNASHAGSHHREFRRHSFQDDHGHSFPVARQDEKVCIFIFLG